MDHNVAAVIGNVVKIYGVSKDGVRPFISKKEFGNHGQALEFANEHDEREKKFAKSRQK